MKKPCSDIRPQRAPWGPLDSGLNLVSRISVGSNLFRFGGLFIFLRFGRFEVQFLGPKKRFGSFEVRF